MLDRIFTVPGLAVIGAAYGAFDAVRTSSFAQNICQIQLDKVDAAVRNSQFDESFLTTCPISFAAARIIMPAVQLAVIGLVCRYANRALNNNGIHLNIQW